jgi:hypothetical protein
MKIEKQKTEPTGANIFGFASVGMGVNFRCVSAKP